MDARVGVIMKTLEQLLNTRIVDLFVDCKDVEELNKAEESFLKMMDMLYAERLHYIRSSEGVIE